MNEPLDAENLAPDATPIDGETDRTTPLAIREALKELLKHGLLEAGRKPNLYRTASTRLAAINDALEPLDLAARQDDIRGLIFLAVRPDAATTPDEEWSHPLIRRRRLTLEQSLLVAILRQHFITHEQQAGIGAMDAAIGLDDLLPQVQLYLGSLGSDSQEQKRLRNILEALKEHGIVSEIDTNDRLSVRPIITHLANPESLKNLLQTFRNVAHGSNEASAQDNDS